MSESPPPAGPTPPTEMPGCQVLPPSVERQKLPPWSGAPGEAAYTNWPPGSNASDGSPPGRCGLSVGSDPGRGAGGVKCSGAAWAAPAVSASAAATTTAAVTVRRLITAGPPSLRNDP